MKKGSASCLIQTLYLYSNQTIKIMSFEKKAYEREHQKILTEIKCELSLDETQLTVVYKVEDKKPSSVRVMKDDE